MADQMVVYVAYRRLKLNRQFFAFEKRCGTLHLLLKSELVQWIIPSLEKAIFFVNLTIHVGLIWQFTTNEVAFMLVYSVLEIHFISRLIHLAHAIFMQRQRQTEHYNQQLCSKSCGMCRARKITNWICDYELFKKRVKCQE